MSDLDKVIYEASKADRDHAKTAGRAVGQALDAHNSQVERKRCQRFDDEIHEITRYHGDRAMTNRTYHI